MTLHELYAAIEEQIARARREGAADVVRAAGLVRAAASEAELTAAFEGFEPGVVEFLKSLAAPREEKHPAQRFARVQVAQIQLYHAAAVKSGRAARDVYGALKAEMEAAREAYREKFLTPVNGTADYLHVEFVRTLANDDAALLGPAYPGALV